MQYDYARLKPRQYLLDIFKNIINATIPKGSIEFENLPESDSIQDAELLLCILLPTTKLQSIGLVLANAGYVSSDLLKALEGWGNLTHIQSDILNAIEVYLQRYSDPANDNRPISRVVVVCLSTTQTPRTESQKPKGDLI